MMDVRPPVQVCKLLRGNSIVGGITGGIIGSIGLIALAVVRWGEKGRGVLESGRLLLSKQIDTVLPTYGFDSRN